MIATFLLLVAFAGIGLGAEIKCYVCTPGAACNDPFTPTNSLSSACPSTVLGEPACIKAKVAGQVTRECSTTLACVATGGENSCTVVDDDNAACCCTTDNCNGADRRLASYAAMFAALVLGKLLAGF